jgi:hypothetical protein
LAELIRQQRASLECWEAYAARRGTLAAAEAEAAARAAGQSAADIARCAELFAPYEDAQLAAMLAAATGGDVPHNVVRPGRWRLPSLAAGIAAIAAGTVFWVTRAPAPAVAPEAAAAPMVAHELSILGVAEVRGSAEAPAPTVPVGATLTFTLRPATAYTVAPTVWACAVKDGTTLRLPTTPSAGKPGTTIEVGAALPSAVTPGAWELVAFVSSMPPAADGTAACAVAESASTKVARGRFVVR